MRKHTSSELQEHTHFDLIDGKHPEDVRRLTRAETVLYYALPPAILVLVGLCVWITFFL